MADRSDPGDGASAPEPSLVARIDRSRYADGDPDPLLNDETQPPTTGRVNAAQATLGRDRGLDAVAAGEGMTSLDSDLADGDREPD